MQSVVEKRPGGAKRKAGAGISARPSGILFYSARLLTVKYA